MSLFTKTVVVNGGVSRRDAEAIAEALKMLAEAVAERVEGLDAEISELKEEIARLKQAPRQSLAQKIRAKGQA